MIGTWMYCVLRYIIFSQWLNFSYFKKASFGILLTGTFIILSDRLILIVYVIVTQGTKHSIRMVAKAGFGKGQYKGQKGLSNWHHGDAEEPLPTSAADVCFGILHERTDLVSLCGSLFQHWIGVRQSRWPTTTMLVRHPPNIIPSARKKRLRRRPRWSSS